MGLTAEIELQLRDANLIQFFEAHEEEYAAMAKESYGYASGYVAQTGLPVRRDDVARALEPALKTNEVLRECLAGKKLRQQYWYHRFGDLILDRLWEGLHSEQ